METVAKHSKILQQTNPSNIYTIGTLQIDITTVPSFFFGMTAAMQYDTNYASDCLYHVVDLFGSIDYVISSFNDLLTTYNVFNFVGYQPVHAYSNLVSAYEVCDGQFYFNQLSMLASLNYATIAEQLTRPLIAAFTTYPTQYAQLMVDYQNGDYYNMGKSMGAMWKTTFDTNFKN